MSLQTVAEAIKEIAKLTADQMEALDNLLPRTLLDEDVVTKKSSEKTQFEAWCY